MKLNAISLLFTVGGILFVVAALGAVVVVPVALKYIGLSEAADLLLRLGRWPAMFVVLTLALAAPRLDRGQPGVGVAKRRLTRAAVTKNGAHERV